MKIPDTPTSPSLISLNGLCGREAPCCLPLPQERSTVRAGLLLFPFYTQWGTVDAERKVSPSEKPQLLKGPLCVAWSWSDYVSIFYFLGALSSFVSISLSIVSVCLFVFVSGVANAGSCVGPQNKQAILLVATDDLCGFPCWEPAEYKIDNFYSRPDVHNWIRKG